MAARPSASREPSLLTNDSLSRRSSLGSNPDIFSDEYALDPIDSSLNLSLVDTLDPDDPTTHATITPYPAIPNRLSVHGRPASTAKRTQTDDAASSSRDAASQRTLSTSSRFSVVRAQSPYTGPTRPSHPYAMYPQITRASSIASQSTIRPPEQPFVHTRGPEHPYSLYPQNTVEDDDEDIGTQPIPLGFSALGFGSSRTTSSTEVGDIVLSDGHIEQLPPYTRYADNVVAKGDMADVQPAHVVEMDTTSSERSSLIHGESSTANPATTTTATIEPESSSERQTRRAGWRRKAHKRVCGGIALWLLIVIIVVVLSAGLIGGIIGGIVGRQQGATEASKSAATTIWLDADPTSTGSDTPTIPVGSYSIPFNRTQDIDACVSQRTCVNAWGCLNIAFLGISIKPDETGCPTVRFDDYSVKTTEFLYGPQPPDFNGSTIRLEPHVDKENEQLGVAMFFYQKVDKLVILPNYALPHDAKRSVTARDIQSWSSKWENTPLQVGHNPWFCFWNQTMTEFWIFLDQSSDGQNLTANSSMSPTSTSTSTSTPPPMPPPSSSWSSWSSSASSSGNPYIKDKGYDQYYPHTDYQPTYGSGAVPTSVGYGDHPDKRSYIAPYYPKYPRLVKMVEKRLPSDNVQPYCQEMQVLVNWEIVPREGGTTIMIDELEWSSDPLVQGVEKRDTTTQLKSNCVCEWMSI